MNSRGDDQLVLDAIENQLRTEDPRLIAFFLAFNGASPPIKPLNARSRPERRDRPAKAGMAELVLLAIAFTLLAAVIATLVWSPDLLS